MCLVIVFLPNTKQLVYLMCLVDYDYSIVLYFYLIMKLISWLYPKQNNVIEKTKEQKKSANQPYRTGAAVLLSRDN